MRYQQRVIYNTTDISEKVNDYRTGSQTFAYTTGTYLYIGSALPFNHLYFEMGTKNNVSANLTVQYWWNNAWNTAVDVQDNTSALFDNGSIFFSPVIDEGWSFERRSSDVTGLSIFNIYNMFWLRMSWDQNLRNTMTLNYIGQKFSTDAILYSYFPDLALQVTKDSFDPNNTSGTKTTWDEQHYMAAEHIVKDLIKRQIIISRSQILDPYLFKDASCYKVAGIVYRGLGRAYADQMADAADRYEKEMNIKFYNIDRNADAQLNPAERITASGYLTR